MLILTIENLMIDLCHSITHLMHMKNFISQIKFHLHSGKTADPQNVGGYVLPHKHTQNKID